MPPPKNLRAIPEEEEEETPLKITLRLRQRRLKDSERINTKSSNNNTVSHT